jgi:hypothetical protein
MREHEEEDRFVGKLGVLAELDVLDWRTAKRAFARANVPLTVLSARKVGSTAKNIQRVLEFHTKGDAS